MVSATFKAITDDEIEHVQDYVSRYLNHILTTKADENKQEYDVNKKKVFFGSYASNAQAFTFNRGEKKLIKIMVNYCTPIGYYFVCRRRTC